MAYNETLAARIRQALSGVKNMEEKKMFGGIAFMVDDKMCLGVNKDDMMLRCEPGHTDELLKHKDVRMFDLSGKPMKGWLLIADKAIEDQQQFDYWVALALNANKKIKASPKK